MAYLVLDRLKKAFKSEQVLDGATLAVNKGETVVVFGPSGAGKTVLLRIIAGIYDPDEGDVLIDNRSMAAVGPEHRDVGMAFQNFALYPHLPAFENIASPLRARRLGDDEIRRRVREVASLLRIEHVLGHFPRALSNGQKQRTALARALVPGPSVLLLDDPLRNVDAKLRYEMRIELPRVLREFGATVVYVTQDYKEAMALGDRVAVLMDGHFRQVAAPADIYREPVHMRIARLFGDPTINLHPCRPERDGLELFGLRWALDAAGAAGRDCLIGIRPEHIEVHTEEVPGAVPVELDAVTPLNVRAVLLLKTGDGRELLATCSEEEIVRFPRGHRAVWARIHLDGALLFDRASGERVAAGVH